MEAWISMPTTLDNHAVDEKSGSSEVDCEAPLDYALYKCQEKILDTSKIM